MVLIPTTDAPETPPPVDAGGGSAVSAVAAKATPTGETRQNLFGLDRQGLRAAFAGMGEAAFRADQVMQWIYQRGHADTAGMTNISRALRARMDEHFVIRPPDLLEEQVSQDGTRKWVLGLDPTAPGRAVKGQAIETVFIPEANRGTLCVSSQVGCAMDCSFCSTAQQGFSRNMNVAEIVAQVWFAARALGANFHDERVISNVVFMGMGEPLANYNALVPAIRILQDDFGFGLSKRRVTVSTSGLVPYMDRLRQDVDTALAVSLHAPVDSLRDELVPINKKYPVAELMAACQRYVSGRERKLHIVYEYVMLDGVNDSPVLARDLARLIGDMPAKVNLIPFNPFPGAPYRRSSAERIRAFGEVLRARRIVTTVRRTRGDDIDAACGQLVGQVISRQANRLGGVPVVVEGAR